MPVSLGVAILLCRWRAPTTYESLSQPSSWRRITFLLLVGHLLINRIRLGTRAGTAIFESGLSSQNRLQVLSTALLGMWAFVLVTSSRVRSQNLIRGQRLWVSALFALFLFSTVWSVTPNLTAYRSVELLSIWILVVHLCKGSDPIRFVASYIQLSILAIFADGLLERASPHLFVPAGLRENTGGLLSACYFILVVCVPRSRVGSSFRGQIFQALLALYCLLIFNSLAAVLSTLVGLAVFAVGGIHRQSLRRLVGVGIAGALGVLLFLPIRIVSSTSEVAARIFNRDVDSVLSGTGRLQLWRIAINESIVHPLGLGLTADRSLRERSAYRVLDWPAASAHNGYVSALIGLGLLGLVLVLTIAFGTFEHVAAYPRAERRALSALLAVYWSNNVSISLFGAWFSPPTIIPLIVLASQWVPTAREVSMAGRKHCLQDRA